MLSVNLSYIPSAITTVEQIKQDQLSQSRFTHHIQTRVRVMELFLRIAFKAGMELLSAAAKLPFAAVKLLLDPIRLGYLLPDSVSFGGVANHLKRSRQCMALLTLDSPGIFIDPSKARAALLYRELVSVEARPKPTAFESLFKRAWTPAGMTLASAVITLAVIYRLGLLSPVQTPTPHSDKDTPQPHGDSSQSSSTENSSSTESSLGWKWALVPIVFLVSAPYLFKECKKVYDLIEKERQLRETIKKHRFPIAWGPDDDKDCLDYLKTHPINNRQVDRWIKDNNWEAKWQELLAKAKGFAEKNAVPPRGLGKKLSLVNCLKAKRLYGASAKTNRQVRDWTREDWENLWAELANSK